MKNVIPLHRKRHIEEEAAAWVARVDGGELSDRDRECLRSWLTEEAEHAAAFERLAKIWRQIDCLGLLAEMIPLAEAPLRRSRSSGQWWGVLQWAGPLGLACVLFAGLLAAMKPDFLPWFSTHGVIVEGVYQTRTGERSQIQLSDGSTLTLNTRSEVRVHMDERQRSVYLNTGEAYFDVAPNPQIPFVVYAGKGAVRAVGTGFNVYIRDQNVEVTVVEGVVGVSVTHADTTQSNPLALRAGGMTRYTDRIEKSRQLSDVQLDRRVAWKGGKLAFDGQTLDEVVRDVGRYTNQRLQIIDPDIAKIRIGGYFDIGQIELFLEALDTGFGIKHRRIAEDLVVLSLHKPAGDESH